MCESETDARVVEQSVLLFPSPLPACGGHLEAPKTPERDNTRSICFPATVGA